MNAGGTSPAQGANERGATAPNMFRATADADMGRVAVGAAELLVCRTRLAASYASHTQNLA